MKASHLLVAITLYCGALAAADYQSPYKVDFTFKEQDLIGDLLQGPRGNWKEEASVPYRDWYDAANQRRWGKWGPAAKHFNPPTGSLRQNPEWSRQRVIATGLRFVGYTYQHHHIPDWEPPTDWPKDEKQTAPVTKGLDCSNFTAFVYNLALGIKPTGDVHDQSALTVAPGPGAGHSTAVKRIEIPANYEDFEKTLLTGDLLFVKSNKGEVSHVVLWVGNIGHSPDGVPLILDSTGSGSKDSNGNEIPNGVHLRPFKRGFWYASKASHALRIIPDEK
jgi:cell wall-associated NlpC family hydrolase